MTEREAWPTIKPTSCDHQHVSALRRRQVGRGVQYRMQCFDCGKAVGNAVAHAQAEREANGPIDDFDETLFERGRLLVPAPPTPQDWERRRAEYEAYLDTPAWQAKRAKVLKRCGGVCEGCGEAPATQAHHLTYAHLGDELLFELVGLCRTCHTAAHTFPSNDELREASLYSDTERLFLSFIRARS